MPDSLNALVVHVELIFLLQTAKRNMRGNKKFKNKMHFSTLYAYSIIEVHKKNVSNMLSSSNMVFHYINLSKANHTIRDFFSLSQIGGLAQRDCRWFLPFSCDVYMFFKVKKINLLLYLSDIY